MRRSVAFLVLTLLLLASACKGKPLDSGGWIAFVSGRTGLLQIYKMRADGSQVTRLTNDPANDFWPSWSPDGNWIAFVREHGGNEEIFKIRADGSQVIRLTDSPVDDLDPSWGP